MDQYSELSLIRRAYAKQLLATAAVGDLHLEQAFATVPRERFLGSRQCVKDVSSEEPLKCYVAVRIMKRQWLAEGQAEIVVREIGTRREGELERTPELRVHLDQLEIMVAGVEAKLGHRDSVPVQSVEKTPPVCGEFRITKALGT